MIFLPLVMTISLYNIKLNINPKEKEYKGTVTLISHSKEIELDCEVNVDEVYYNNQLVKHSLKDNKLKIDLTEKDSFEEKSYEVRIDFTGQIYDSLSGLYRSNETLVTHFEPNDARKMFPCLDTPSSKSIFGMTVSVPKDYFVIFNTELRKVSEYKEYFTYEFNFTPLMSSYLLALSVGKYDMIELNELNYKIKRHKEIMKEIVEEKSKEESKEEIVHENKKIKEENKKIKENSKEIVHENDSLIKLVKESQKSELESNLIKFSKELEKKHTKLRIYTEEGLAHTAKLAIVLTDQLVKRLGEMFDYPFVLEKLDQLALKRFGMGAMENFGLITYRESLLLFDRESNPSYVAYIAETVAHELVHQWFGNLVTPSSWEDLWLNEGFATFLSNYILDEYEYFIPSLHQENNNKLKTDDKNNKDKISKTDDIKRLKTDDKNKDNTKSDKRLKTDESKTSNKDNINDINKDNIKSEGVLDCTDKLNYNFMNDFISHSENGLFLDSLSSHPIISSSDVNELFDEITYQKSSSVIKMLFLDKIHLLKGYINKFAYKSVKSKDILEYLGLEMIYDWLYKKHYPVLVVEFSEESVKISQEVFTLLPNSDDTVWFVPVRIDYDGKESVFEIKEREINISLSEIINGNSSKTNKKISKTKEMNLNKNNEDMNNKNSKSEESKNEMNLNNKNISNKTDKNISIKNIINNKTNISKESVNPKKSVNFEKSKFKINNGFFRVFYKDISLYRNISIHTVNDLYSLFLRGNISLEDYLSVVKDSFYDDYHTFESVSNQLISLIYKVNLDKKYLLNILERKTLGNDLMSLKREALRLKLLVLLGSQVEIPDNPFFRTARFIQKVRLNLHNEVFLRYKNTTVPDERSTAILSLFTTGNLTLLKEYFNKLISKEINISDSIYVFRGLGSNLELRDDIFELVLQTDLVSLFGSDKNLLGDCLESVFTNVPDKYVERVRKYVDIKGIDFKKSVILEMIEVDKRVRERVNKTN